MHNTYCSIWIASSCWLRMDIVSDRNLDLLQLKQFRNRDHEAWKPEIQALKRVPFVCSWLIAQQWKCIYKLRVALQEPRCFHGQLFSNLYWTNITSWSFLRCILRFWVTRTFCTAFDMVSSLRNWYIYNNSRRDSEFQIRLYLIFILDAII